MNLTIHMKIRNWTSNHSLRNPKLEHGEYFPITGPIISDLNFFIFSAIPYTIIEIFILIFFSVIQFFKI